MKENFECLKQNACRGKDFFPGDEPAREGIADAQATQTYKTIICLCRHRQRACTASLSSGKLDFVLPQCYSWRSMPWAYPQCRSCRSGSPLACHDGGPRTTDACTIGWPPASSVRCSGIQ